MATTTPAAGKAPTAAPTPKPFAVTAPSTPSLLETQDTTTYKETVLRGKNFSATLVAKHTGWEITRLERRNGQGLIESIDMKAILELGEILSTAARIGGEHIAELKI